MIVIELEICWSERHEGPSSWDKVANWKHESKGWQDMLTGEAFRTRTSGVLPEVCGPWG